MFNNKLKEIRFEPNPEMILVADGPLHSGAPIRALPVDAFAKSEGMKWRELSLMVDQDYKMDTSKKQSGIEVTKEEFQIMKNSINSVRNNLIIAPMEGNVGKGVFARTTIPAAVCIGIYTGYFADTLDKIKDPKQKYMYGSVSSDKTDSNIIDAKYFGNITRFLQHLPEAKVSDNEKETVPISEYSFKAPYSADMVATENLIVRKIQYKGYGLFAFFTTRELQPFEQLGFNYGYDYWKILNERPCLFDKTAKIIPKECYSSPLTLKVAIKGSELDGMVSTINHLTMDDIKLAAEIGMKIALPKGEEGFIFVPPKKFQEALIKSPDALYFYIDMELGPKKENAKADASALIGQTMFADSADTSVQTLEGYISRLAL